MAQITAITYDDVMSACRSLGFHSNLSLVTAIINTANSYANDSNSAINSAIIIISRDIKLSSPIAYSTLFENYV